MTLFLCLALSIVFGAQVPPTCLDTIQQSSEITPEQADELKAAIQDLATADEASMREAIARLYVLPGRHVVSAVAETIQHNPAFHAEAKRRAAYDVLINMGGARHEKGFEQLLRGLNDQSVALMSLQALAATPPERHEALVDAVGPIVPADTRSAFERGKAIDLLAMTDSLATEHLPVLAKLSADAEQHELIRTNAAYTMIRIGGAGWALEEFNISEPEKHAAADMLILLSAIGRAGGETGGTMNDEAAARLDLRRWVLGSMDHANPEVRRAAATALGYTYDESGFLGMTAEEHALAEDVISRFQAMAKNDPDPELRALADGMLRQRLLLAMRKQVDIWKDFEPE